MVRTVPDPSPRLLSAVAAACAASGLYADARDVVRSVRDAALREAVEEEEGASTGGAGIADRGPAALRELPRLHRRLLRLCARSGNVTAALWYVDDFQEACALLSERLPKDRPAAADAKEVGQR